VKIRATMMIDVNVKTYTEAAEFEALVADLVELPSEQFAVEYAGSKINERREKKGKPPNINDMKLVHI